MELIDKHAAYTALKHEEETHGLSFSAEAFGKAARIIDQMPTIEAEPVRHGRWKDRPLRQVFECEICGAVNTNRSLFCPRCGARMDGGAENG